MQLLNINYTDIYNDIDILDINLGIYVRGVIR